jgi:hypothetical protein
MRPGWRRLALFLGAFTLGAILECGYQGGAMAAALQVRITDCGR